MEEERIQAFEEVIRYFEENDEEQLTIQALTDKMEEYLENFRMRALQQPVHEEENN